MKQKSIDELNKCYKEAESCDSEVFAEQRSNILLVAGEHYQRKKTEFWNRVRDSKQLNAEQKLRLTANHLYKISKLRTNIILSHASGVRIFPNNASELQDQKAAELNQSVWEFIKRKQSMRKKTGQFGFDYFNIGEVACKIFWDENKGELLGYEQDVNELGEPLLDDNGEPKKGRPIFSGEVVIERILPFNLLRSPQAKTMEESPYLIYRKVVYTDELLEMVKGDEEKENLVKGGKDETYFVFDSNKTQYGKEDNVTTLREHYYRPCPEYPEGYYYICTDKGILWEGVLPFGIFPIEYEGHDEIPTTPRHRSPIKQLRPFQIEINRAMSKIAEHQVTLGDDKLIVQNGSKVSSGAVLPGVRAIQVTGMAPTVLEGRAGNQYMPYLEQVISQLYQAANISEDIEETQGGDAWSSLWKSVRHKKKFIMDAEKFEGFLVRVCEKALLVAKNYMEPNILINVVGKQEFVNIEEFKNIAPQGYQIKVEPASDDIETVMGKQLMLNHILQYSSGQLKREDIGKLIRMMPFANNEQIFSDFTMEFDRATNIILALDRGEFVEPNKYDDGPYIIKRLTTRMSQSDFVLLPQEIRENYGNLVSLYEEMEAKKAQELKAMQAEFIPTDGANIKVAWYVKDPTNPSRSVQATLPASSINWLVQRLSEQGYSQEQIQRNEKGVAGIAEKFNAMNGATGMDQQNIQGEGQANAPINPDQDLLNRLQGVLQ